jgi:hypothetical protein
MQKREGQDYGRNVDKLLLDHKLSKTGRICGLADEGLLHAPRPPLPHHHIGSRVQVPAGICPIVARMLPLPAMTEQLQHPMELFLQSPYTFVARCLLNQTKSPCIQFLEAHRLTWSLHFRDTHSDVMFLSSAFNSPWPSRF